MVETAEAWDVALKTNGPTVLALSRQGLKAYRSEKTNKNLVSYGGYILNNISKDRDITLIATGSEIEIAMEASEKCIKKVLKLLSFRFLAGNYLINKVKNIKIKF